MRVEIADQTSHPVPQFIIYAENEADFAILRSFVNYPQMSRRPVQFRMHGSCYSNSRVTSFNFGYSYASKLSLWQWVRGWWRGYNY